MSTSVPKHSEKQERPAPLQVNLYPEQRRLLEERSKLTGAPLGELIRRAVQVVYSDDDGVSA